MKKIQLLLLSILLTGNFAFTQSQCVSGNCKDGVCTINFANGEIYTGDFKNGKRSGKGIMTFNTGGKYDGQWKEDEKDGYGVENFKDGAIYTWEWKNDKKEGKGVMRYKDVEGKDAGSYEGEWKNDLFDGRGIIISENGDKYDGEWKTGLKQGLGIMTYANGSNYNGQWKENWWGDGIFTTVDGEKRIKKSGITPTDNSNPSASNTNTTSTSASTKPSSTQTTAGGVQYSTADMSEFTNKYRLLGVMIVYSEATQFSKPFPYFFDVYGTSMKNENAVFNALKGRLNSYYNYSKYSWKPGASTFSLTRGLDLRSYETKGKYDIE